MEDEQEHSEMLQNIPSENENRHPPNMGGEGAEEGEDGAEETATGYKKLNFKDPMELSFLAPLPFEVTIRTIPNLNDSRGLWRSGIKDVENCFMDLLQRMNMEFDLKVGELDKVAKKIVANHDFLTNWYMEMQRKLNEKNDLIMIERMKWEAEKDEIKGMIDLDSEVVALNVGGTHHLLTERDVLRLCPGSILEKMFNGMHELKKINEEVFLDRDGKTFLNMVNYLRNDREVYPDFMDRNDEVQFMKELDFWKVPQKYQNNSAKKSYKGPSLAPIPAPVPRMSRQ